MNLKTFTFLCVLGWASIAQAQETRYKNLVFEGAGMRGLAYTGVISELDQLGILQHIEKFGGTSAGSIISLALAVGYSPEEIQDIIYHTNFSKFNDSGFFFISGIGRINKKFGYYKGDRFMRWLEKLIEAKTGDPNITFEGLPASGFKDLYVIATSLNHQKTIVFSKDDYPTMRIKDAVRASMSVPLYFQAIYVDGEGHVHDRKDATPDMDLMVDGGITGNFPIHIFDSEKTIDGVVVRIPNRETLGVRIDTKEQIYYDQKDHQLAPVQVQNVKDYMEAFYVFVVESLNRNQLTDQDWSRTISVSDAGVGPKIKKLEKAQKEALVQSGIAGVKDYFGGTIASKSTSPTEMIRSNQP